MENNVYQSFFSDLFLSGAVYSFKQNNDDTKIAAACAEGWHLNCPEPSLSPSPRPWCIALFITSFHDRGNRRCPGTKTNARHVEPGVFFYGFIFFFLLDPAPFLFVDLKVLMSLPHSLFFTLYALCFCFETRVPILYCLSCWVSPKEHFGDRNILHSLGRAEGFNHILSPQEVGGDRWQWCLKHQELDILLRKPLHRTYQELSWLGHSPRRDIGDLLDPSCCFRGISPLTTIPVPLPSSSSDMDGTLGNSDCQGDGLLAWSPLFYPIVTPKKKVHMACICIKVGLTERRGFNYSCLLLVLIFPAVYWGGVGGKKPGMYI